MTFSDVHSCTSLFFVYSALSAAEVPPCGLIMASVPVFVRFCVHRVHRVYITFFLLYTG